jgi:hypothetical protein
MIYEIVTGICNTLNGTLSNANYRPAGVDFEDSTAVQCSVKVMLGKQMLAGLGTSDFDHYGWLYFDFGSNDQRAPLLVVQAIDELIDWLVTAYGKGTGYDIGSGNYIRDMEHIPFQGYPQPKERFYQDMILVRFIWERR